MAKRKVKFNVVDGLRPIKDGNVLNLKVPIPLNLRPGHELKVDLGLSCSEPALLLEPTGIKSRGLQITVPPPLDAGTPLQVTVKNLTQTVVLVDAGDVIARAVLFGGDFELE